MLYAYINYPNPHITIHKSSSCGNIQQQHKKSQRVVHLNSNTLSSELLNFKEKHYKFGANPETNDMWLIVDFNPEEIEQGIVDDVLDLLKKHYSPFRKVTPKVHCEL